MLTVVVDASKHDLVDLSLVKSDLCLLSASEDAALRAWIRSASAVIESYCGRVFAVQCLEQQFWLPDSVIALGKYPITDIDSVTADGVSLSESEYLCDHASGLLYRIRNGRRSAWNAEHVAVEFDAGFCEIPGTIQGKAASYSESFG